MKIICRLAIGMSVWCVIIFVIICFKTLSYYPDIVSILMRKNIGNEYLAVPISSIYIIQTIMSCEAIFKLL